AELQRVPPADTRDERSARDARRSRRDRLLQLGDAERALDTTLLVARIDPGAGVVHVRIDEAREHGAAAEVDGRKRPVRIEPRPDRADPAVREQERVADDPAVVDE